MCNKKKIVVQALVSKLVLTFFFLLHPYLLSSLPGLSNYHHYCLGLTLKFLWNVMNRSRAHLYAVSPSDGEHSPGFRNLSFCLHHNNLKLVQCFPLIFFWDGKRFVSLLRSGFQLFKDIRAFCVFKMVVRFYH